MCLERVSEKTPRVICLVIPLPGCTGVSEKHHKRELKKQQHLTAVPNYIYDAFI